MAQLNTTYNWNALATQQHGGADTQTFSGSKRMDDISDQVAHTQAAQSLGC